MSRSGRLAAAAAVGRVLGTLPRPVAAHAIGGTFQLPVPLFLYLGWQVRAAPRAALITAFAGLQALLAVLFFTWRPFF